MKVYRSHKEIKKSKKGATDTEGVFDGMHLGHQRVIKQAVKCAKKIRLKSFVITFKDNPDGYLRKSKESSFIKSPEAKLKRISMCGVDRAAMLDFKEVAKIPADDFIKDIIAGKLAARCVVTGRDFVFGRGGGGNVKTLEKAGKKYGFKVIVPPDMKIKGRRISSTLIRKYLKSGNIRLVEKMLGRPYCLSGRVVRGRKIGFEFPTANIKLPYADIPARGVWAVSVIHGGKEYAGAANIGFAPTLKALDEVLLEVYMLDFNKKIYGDEIRVVFLERLRDERKFGNHDALLKQVRKDVGYIREKYGKK